jgi:hypothetical protein
MAMNPPPNPLPPAEQGRYARWLQWTSRAGLAVLVMTFFLYLSGLVPPLVAHERLPSVWNLSAAEYQRATGSPTGWGWLGLLGHSDIASLVGIAVLASCSIACLAAIMPFYARRRERVYVVICLLEIGVLLLAASGILNFGH